MIYVLFVEVINTITPIVLTNNLYKGVIICIKGLIVSFYSHNWTVTKKFDFFLTLSFSYNTTVNLQYIQNVRIYYQLQH